MPNGFYPNNTANNVNNSLYTSELGGVTLDEDLTSEPHIKTSQQEGTSIFKNTFNRGAGEREFGKEEKYVYKSFKRNIKLVKPNRLQRGHLKKG